MTKIFIKPLLIGLLLHYVNFFSALELPKVSKDKAVVFSTTTLKADLEPDPAMKQKAFEVLQTKCNVCHKKKNPFKVFSLKNMDKHAPKIYQQVFVYQRMPKGDKIKLTEEESQTLRNWLKSKNNF